VHGVRKLSATLAADGGAAAQFSAPKVWCGNQNRKLNEINVIF
jgi:hypothetical protein